MDMESKKAQKGFTLIELMIVVAIIGILAAVAIPAYQDYIARAQVSEAVTLIGGAKTPLAEFYADNGRYPANISSVVPVTTGTYVGSIALSSPSGGTVSILATMKASGVNANIVSGTVEMYTTNGGNSWLCRPGSTGSALDARYLPGACK